MTHSKTGSHSTESLSLKRDEERSSSSEKDVTCHELPQKSDESLQRCINASNAFNAFSASPPPLPSLRPHSIFPNFIQPSFPASQPSLQITVHSISSNPPSVPLQASTPQASDEGSKDGGGFIDLDNLKEEWPEELLGSEGSFGEEIFDKNSYASSNNYAQDKVRERRIFLIKQITLASAVLFGTGIFVGLVGLALYKIKIRNQGTYKVNNRQEYFYEPCSTSNHCLSSSSRIQVDQSSSDQLNQPSFPPRKKDKQKNKKAKSLEVVRKEDREWYV